MMKQRLAALIGIMSFCLLCRADQVEANALATLKNGRHIFRFDTFGDQAFWGDTLKLHQAIEGANHGGVGPGVSPKTALAVGLKVDVDALPIGGSILPRMRNLVAPMRLLSIRRCAYIE